MAQIIQVAQLSQRDRATGWVSYGQKWNMELGDNIYGLCRSVFNLHCAEFGQQSNRNRPKKRQIRAITPFKVIQGHRSRYQSKARM